MSPKDLTRTSLPDLAAWVGREEVSEGAVHAVTARAIHATLCHTDGNAPAAGALLPPLWHWYGFPPTAGMGELGEDGHPALGGFLPPVPYERRMWAAGSLTFHGNLRVGERLERRSRIASIDEKSGASGGMVFVVVEHEIHGAEGLAVRESQSIVYLPIPSQYTPPPKKEGPLDALVIDEKQPISTPLLFRYSAITFNAHRIHYDLQYAQQTEHYPGLVVHGPLQANLLMAAAAEWKGRCPDRFAFRGVHPMFHDHDLNVRATLREGGTLSLCTVADAGHMGMTATAEWED